MQDFGPLKRKVYLAYHQDGILDLVLPKIAKSKRRTIEVK